MIDSFADWDNDTQQDWLEYISYCRQDARITFVIAQAFSHFLASKEERAFNVTHQMNQRGWHVDLNAVQRMQKAYKLNLERLEREFHIRYPNPDGSELNFRSTPQLRKWCKERGVNLTSIDELSVQKALTRIQNRLSRGAMPGAQSSKLHEVHDLLETKQMLGGSSLSKLQKILDMIGADDRLREQYLHVGAGQTYRTSGQGVRLQNLKRLGAEIDDLDGDLSDWDNERLARNLRQVFEAEHPDGLLFVGDFSAVESRGLAYLAGAEWKLDAYRQGKDMYKVLASSMLGIPYERIDKPQRQLGKVGELSCGYGAGPGAVKDFAEKMGTILSDDEANTLVRDWRDANPESTKFWSKLHDILLTVIRDKQGVAEFTSNGLVFRVFQTVTPQSVSEQRPDARTVAVEIRNSFGSVLVHRVFQGTYMHGNDMCYLKPSELKGGKLWLEEWTKDRQKGRYKIYGGKLAGILTQSFCRELFFNSMSVLDRELANIPNASIVGQFHDEIVVEWSPPLIDDGSDLLVRRIMEECMSTTDFVENFPLASEINFSHKYIK